MLEDKEGKKAEIAQESLAILKKREKLAKHFEKLEGKITDQSLNRVKVSIMRSLERGSEHRTLLQTKQVQLASEMELSGKVKSVITKIKEAKKLL